MNSTQYRTRLLISAASGRIDRSPSTAFHEFGTRKGLILRVVVLACVILLTTYSVSAQLPNLIGTIQGEQNTLLGWEIIPVGDQNGDGYDDILVYDWGTVPQPPVHRAKLFYGGPTLDTVSDLVIGDSVYFYLSNLGDFTGDGFVDFSVGTVSGGHWRASVYYGGPSNDGNHDIWLGSDAFGPRGNGVRGWDIDRNGSDELIYASQAYKSFLVFELQPTVDSLPDRLFSPPDGYAPSSFTFAEQLRIGDFNSDGLKDLAASLRPDPKYSRNGQVHVYFGGTGFDSIPDLVLTRPGSFSSDQDNWGDRITVLDYNGDGYDDLLAGAHPSDDTTAFIYFGGPGFDTIPDMSILGKADVAAPAGDLNNDGYQDLIRGYPLPFAGDGWVDIFLGGPDADSVRDVRLHNSVIPGLQYEVGRSATGIGDFNDDGIDDFAFSCEGSLNEGIVYIYSGWSGSLDVEYDYDPVLPTESVLKQNYPNPFNAATQIEFGLPEAGHVRLAVYDILGRELRRLVDRELSGGTYVVQWDGKVDSGEEVASGVYLAKLSLGNMTLNRKMLLLK